MPCTYYQPGEEERIALCELKSELDVATRVACELMSIATDKGHDVSEEAERWYAAHLEMDKRRLEDARRERQRRDEARAAESDRRELERLKERELRRRAHERAQASGQEVSLTGEERLRQRALELVEEQKSKG